MNNLVTSQSRYILYAVLFLVLAVSLIILFKILLITSYFDFTYYYLALQAYIKGQNPYLLKIFPFPYPPLAILTLLPFTIFSLPLAAKSFVVLSFISLFFSLFILFRLFTIRFYSTQGIILLILLCNYFPAKYSLAGGQINTLVLLFIVLFINWFVKRKDILAGMALAIAVMLKLYPLFIFPYLFFIKRYSLIKSFIISLLVISIFLLIFVPFPVIASYFTTTLPLFFSTGGGTYYFDQSLSAFIARSITSSFAVEFSKPLALMVLLISYGMLWKYRNTEKIELLGISILLILNIILGNFAWQHHFIWLIIPYIITFIFIKNSELPNRFYGILIASYLLTAANIPNPRLFPPFIQSHVFYGACILYGLLLYVIISQPKRFPTITTKLRIKNKASAKHKAK